MVAAQNWKDYSSGIFTNCDDNVNAAVLVVGMTDQYWRAKNSWGVGWGENGYIRISKQMACGICSAAIYPII
jgi:C1A family cysteine protease